MTDTSNAQRQARRQLRRELRARRNAIPPWRRLVLTRRIEAAVARLPQLRRGAAVGMYSHFGSEVPSTGLRALALRRGCRLYLPTISNFYQYTMDFRRDYGRPMPRNRMGIAEPKGTPILDIRQLDLVVIPMVGFDAAGYRIGNGAGYYDRMLGARAPERLRAAHAGAAASAPPAPFWPRPLLVGVAFECQRLEHIEAAAHDVPLDAVITELGLRHARRE